MTGERGAQSESPPGAVGCRLAEFLPHSRMEFMNIGVK
jgi:hypothetical protein